MSYSKDDCKLRAHVQLPMLCNMEPPCPYCGTREDWGGKMHRLNFDEGQRWYSALHDFSEEFGPVYHTVLWGEPTADDVLLKIFGKLTTRLHVEFVSNIVRDPAEWVVAIEDLESFSIVASYHPHYWGTTDRFLRRVDLLRGLGVSVDMVFVLAYPPNFDHCISARDELAAAGLTVALMPFGGEIGGMTYPRDYSGKMWSDLSEDLERMWGRSDLIRGTDERPTGIICRTGIDYVWIGQNGDVYSCYVHDRAMRLGNIFERNVRLLSRPMPCRAERCSCPDMYVYMEQGRAEDGER